MTQQDLLSEARKATGIAFTYQHLELIFSMQTTEQNEQYRSDLLTLIAIHRDTCQHNGMMADSAIPIWEELSKRIALWGVWAEWATPVKQGLFGKKKISVTRKLMLRDVLSPECELMKSGKLDI